MGDSGNFHGHFDDIFPSPTLKSQRIERAGGKHFGEFMLDAETASFLGIEDVGVFLGSCGMLPQIIRKLKFLDDSPGKAVWITVLGTKLRHQALFDQWDDPESGLKTKTRDLPPYWQSKKLVFLTPEKLSKWSCENEASMQCVAGIILVDLDCNVHKQRGHSTMANDRPQHIVNFRASLYRMGWSPPLIVMTRKATRSVNVDEMRSAYCLEAWWFLDGTFYTFNAYGLTQP